MAPVFTLIPAREPIRIPRVPHEKVAILQKSQLMREVASSGTKTSGLIEWHARRERGGGRLTAGGRVNRIVPLSMVWGG